MIQVKYQLSFKLSKGLLFFFEQIITFVDVNKTVVVKRAIGCCKLIYHRGPSRSFGEQGDMAIYFQETKGYLEVTFRKTRELFREQRNIDFLAWKNIPSVCFCFQTLQYTTFLLFLWPLAVSCEWKEAWSHFQSSEKKNW